MTQIDVVKIKCILCTQLQCNMKNRFDYVSNFIGIVFFNHITYEISIVLRHKIYFY